MIELLVTVAASTDLYAQRLSRTLPEVRGRIERAASAAGRSTDSVRLVAVSKGHPVDAVVAALDAGLADLGENRIEELERKAAHVGSRPVRWHLIGHVQSRKAAPAVRLADLIHSVDSLKLAGKLSRAAEEEGRGKVPVLLQVNTSGEGSKSGFEGGGALEALAEASEVPRLSVMGLMTMAPLTEDERVLRSTFARLRELLESLRRLKPATGAELSMGMTNDLELAVEEGSTMVRIGTALFGERIAQVEKP
jgi:pyridoxal phosphate enzyme (YggS family)